MSLRARIFTRGKTIKLYISCGSPEVVTTCLARSVPRATSASICPGNPAVTPQNMPGAPPSTRDELPLQCRPQGWAFAGHCKSVAQIEALQTPGVRFTTRTQLDRPDLTEHQRDHEHGRPSKPLTMQKSMITAIAATSPLTLASQVMNATGRGLAGYAIPLQLFSPWSVGKWRARDGLLGDAEYDRSGSRRGLRCSTPTFSRSEGRACCNGNRHLTRMTSVFYPFSSSGADVGYAILQPGVWPDRIEILRAAFTQMTLDPAFKEDSEKWEIDLRANGGRLTDHDRERHRFPGERARSAEEVAKAE